VIAFDGARAEARAETRPAPCRENWGLRPIVRLQVGHIQEVRPNAPLYGWWAASYKEQSEKQLGALDDVRATSVWFTLASTRDRQPLGSSPNHAHATEDNTPCWGESAVATRVGFNPDGSSTGLNPTLPPTGQQRVREGANRPRITARVVATRGCTSHHWVQPRGCTSHHGCHPCLSHR